MHEFEFEMPLTSSLVIPLDISADTENIAELIRRSFSTVA